MNGSYLPNTDSDRVVWFNNFSTKISGYATALSLTAADVTSVQHDNAMYAYVINYLEILKQTQQNLTAYKNLLKHLTNVQVLGALPALPTLSTAPALVGGGAFDRVRQIVQRIKNSANYTNAIGQDLNIIAPIDTTDVTTMAPVLTIKLDVGRPHLKWSKGTLAEAIDLYADHNDGNGFVLVGRLMKSDYLDVTPLGTGKVIDTWHYKAIFVIADEQVGLYSATTDIKVIKTS